MNRPARMDTLVDLDVPRTRGDEPYQTPTNEIIEGMFPAHAGMNRCFPQQPRSGKDVPRTRGDEPRDEIDVHTRVHVPRTRGDEPDKDGNVVPEEICSPHTRG